MSPENDQTRWIGIRPTNPAENIPVNAVRPAGTISNLQAIKDTYYDDSSSGIANCVVEFTRDLSVVPASELWIVTHISIKNMTTFCDLWIQVFMGVALRDIMCIPSVEPGIVKTWNGTLVLKEGNYIRGSFRLGGGVDTVYIYAHGYKIGVY